MGITVLPDWGKDLGQSLAQAGSGISKIIDPLLDFHTKFAEQAAANPEIEDNLAGHAFVNEGDLGPAAKFIPKKILADIKDRASKGLVPPEFFKTKAGIDVGRMERDPNGEVSPEQIAKLKPYGGFTNQEWYDLGRAKIAGQSIGSTSEDLAMAPMAKLLGKIKTEEAQNILAYRAALTPAQRETMDAFKYDELFRFNMRVQADTNMMNSRDEAEFNRWSKESDQRYGYWLSEHYGGGDPQDWVRWRHDSALRDKVKEHMASGQMTDEDNRFAEIDRLDQARSVRLNSLEMSRLSALMDNAKDKINGNPQKKIKPADEGYRGALLTRLNVDLADYASTTKTQPMQAFYGNLYDLKKKPLGPEKESKRKGIGGPFETFSQEEVEQMKAQAKAKENRLHVVVNPYTPNAKEVDPNDVSDMLDASVKTTSQQSTQENPVTHNPQVPQQPGKTEVVEPQHPATSDEVIGAAKQRYTVIRDSMTKAGIPKDEARKRAAQTVEQIFNIDLTKGQQ